MENQPGAFLTNLTEPLLIDDHVGHGLKSNNVVNGIFNTTDPGSRQRNFDHRNDNVNTGDILFDQILVSARVLPFYEMGSAAVFNRPNAVIGNNRNRVSDHVPVYADFVFSGDHGGGSTGDEEREIFISALLPNPQGDDHNHEVVELTNTTSSAVSLQGSATGSYRVFRGGSWRYSARHCRSAERGGSAPDNHCWDVGFRLVLLPGQ